MTQANGGATPLVTVITPAYNVARYIGEAVELGPPAVVPGL